MANCVYLKINRNSEQSILCCQYWLEVAKLIGNRVIIICDNKDLEKNVRERLNFNNLDFEFIESYREPFAPFINLIANPYWLNAANAHLTTYYHAHINNYKSFYNIDADDTMFVLEPEVIAKGLIEAENYANNNNLDNFSLDMWRSISFGRHWSFGIVYTRINLDYFKLLNSLDSTHWQEHYPKPGISDELLSGYNLDWFFTYLKDYGGFKNKTFYFENSIFFHYGLFRLNDIGTQLCHWKDKNINYPIIEIFCKNEGNKGIIPIYDDCIKFDINITNNNICDFSKKSILKNGLIDHILYKNQHN